MNGYGISPTYPNWWSTEDFPRPPLVGVTTSLQVSAAESITVTESVTKRSITRLSVNVHEHIFVGETSL